ncbi:MAG: carbohydrate porin [Bacilli bacterium]
MQKILGWKGAKFVVSGAYNAGETYPTALEIFLPPPSRALQRAMFYEMYLAQTVNLPWNDTFKVRLGRMSMGDTFCSLPAFGYLVSGGIDANPEALFANSPFTASTIATWGITAQYNTIENLSFAAGLYQVPPNINSSGWDGTNFTINSDDGYMMLFQATWSSAIWQR